VVCQNVNILLIMNSGMTKQAGLRSRYAKHNCYLHDYTPPTVPTPPRATVAGLKLHQSRKKKKHSNYSRKISSCRRMRNCKLLRQNKKPNREIRISESVLCTWRQLLNAESLPPYSRRPRAAVSVITRSMEDRDELLSF
jgi:hypothetical protein